MSSIVEGYEYDIFISYRQKDNKYDGWVTEFVNNLRKELEATFKEDISIYFDENPHDGILDTYNVDKSLENKIKSLIFIPIISQTYCDPKSFAWQNEFIAFNKASTNDLIGRNIKLLNGNVTGRILPVKIHDLDEADKTLLESELGGSVRSVEFIFKSLGVNRPLKPNDTRTENLDHTYYRDQINKVANAVKEIITALKFHGGNQNELIIQKLDPKSNTVYKESKKLNLKIAIWSILILVLAVSGYLLLPVLYNTSPENTDKSIAVLPFENLSNDPDQEYFSDGMTEEILNHLYKIDELKVASRTSTMSYKGSRKMINEICRELGVKYILEGSVRKYGKMIRIQIQLVSAKTHQNVVWSEDYNREITIENILEIQSEVARQVAFRLKAKIIPEVERNLENHVTNNNLAYDWYLKGLKYSKLFWNANPKLDLIDTAIRYYLKAIDLDPEFSMAYTGLGKCYWTLAHLSPNSGVSNWLESERALKRAIELDPSNGLAYANCAFVQYSWGWDKKGAEMSLDKAIHLMPGDWEIRKNAFNYYIRTGQCEKARSELEQLPRLDRENRKNGGNFIWLSLCEGTVGSENHFSENLLKNFSMDSSDLELANVYLIEKQYSKAMKIAELGFVENAIFYLNYLAFYGVGAALSGKTDKALFTIEKMKEISKYRQVPDTFFAQIYFALGDEETSYKYLDKALLVHDFWLHDLKRYEPFYSHRDDPRFKKIIERSWIPWRTTETKNE